jgi:hypothetical protein
MQRVRQRDIDRVELGIGEQVVVGVVRTRDPVLVRVRLGARSVA